MFYTKALPADACVTIFFTQAFEPLARVILYITDIHVETTSGRSVASHPFSIPSTALAALLCWRNSRSDFGYSLVLAA